MTKYELIAFLLGAATPLLVIGLVELKLKTRKKLASIRETIDEFAARMEPSSHEVLWEIDRILKG